MERKKTLIVLLLVILMTGFCAAGNNSQVYKAYLSGKMTDWKKIIDTMELSPAKDNAYLSELLNYQYGYIGYCLGVKNKEEAARVLALAEENNEILEGRKYNLSMVYAYKAAFYGFRIGMNPVKAPLLGPRSKHAAEKSLQFDSANWLGWVQMASIEYYMPAVFGGSKQKAIEYFHKARELMEGNQQLVTGNWNYLGVLVSIAESYEGLNDLKSARHWCEKILEKEPGFTYVRNEIYPRIMEKIKSAK